MPHRRHLLPWHHPLLPQVVEWLATGWGGHGPLDLSNLLVVVPTQQAGRRLREALAKHAAAHGQAVFPPRVVPPEALVRLGAPTGGVATRSETQLAWIAVLRDIRLDDFRVVFPTDPPARDFNWARRLAEQLLKLQATLAESAMRIADVPARMGRSFPEAERWAQLGALERRYDSALARRDRRDPQVVKIAWVESGAEAWPTGVDRIIVLATPDPLPLAVQRLARLATQGPVEVVMFGPDEMEFDDWGRPRPDAWATRGLDWPEFERHVHLCSDPADQAARMVALAQTKIVPATGGEASTLARAGVLAVGVGDPEVLAPLEDGLARADVAAFNPGGRARKLDALYALLEALADFAREDSFAHTAALARCPDVLEWLRKREKDETHTQTTPRLGISFSAAQLLHELDLLQARHLPPTLAAARAQMREDRYGTAEFALGALAELRGILNRGDFPGCAAAALTALFAAQRLAPNSKLAESAEVWRDTMREIEGALALFPGATRAEGWELALAAFALTTRTEEKPADALELNGWLELLWEDAPQLVVAGLNDGRVPEAVAGDGFLPEALRGPLGLKTNADRFARDAYLLAALLASRRNGGGQLDLLVGRVSTAGDPLRPSRLLLRCAEAELPQRVAFLFREVGAAEANVPWGRAWKLQPQMRPPPKKVSVTALREWLACPFRFYLKHVLRMERKDLEKQEMDAMDFGTLIHAALQEMGEDPALRDCADEARLRTGLLARFEREARGRFGAAPTLPLIVQLESARQRLGAVARVQAGERAAGWRIERVEWEFKHQLGGIEVRGKIDRIDRHGETGAIRVLDYKTSDQAVSPAAAHLGPVGLAEAERPLWTRVMDGDEPRAWKDLQLPLYRLAVAEEFGSDVACGYFNLPKAVGDTAISLWEGLTPNVQAAAEECASRAAAAIAAGEFWPPTERDPKKDEAWADLFHHGAAASVDWVAGKTEAPKRADAVVPQGGIA